MNVYNKKDIVRINQEVGETGSFQNESSLDFALDLIKTNKSWMFELGYLIRTMLIDHIFRDGNKRTAYMLCIFYFEDRRREYDDSRLIEAITKIASKNISDINKIVKELKKC